MLKSPLSKFPRRLKTILFPCLLQSLFHMRRIGGKAVWFIKGYICLSSLITCSASRPCLLLLSINNNIRETEYLKLQYPYQLPLDQSKARRIHKPLVSSHWSRASLSYPLLPFQQASPNPIKMVGLQGDPPTTANSSSINPTNSSSASPTCGHDCTVIALSVAIPVLALFIIGILVFGLLHRRREMRRNEAKDQETAVAMRKLGPESESSSVTQGFGDFRAVANLDGGADAVRELEKPSRSWKPRDWSLQSAGWWRM